MQRIASDLYRYTGPQDTQFYFEDRKLDFDVKSFLTVDLS